MTELLLGLNFSFGPIKASLKMLPDFCHLAYFHVHGLTDVDISTTGCKISLIPRKFTVSRFTWSLQSGPAFFLVFSQSIFFPFWKLFNYLWLSGKKPRWNAGPNWSGHVTGPYWRQNGPDRAYGN